MPGQGSSWESGCRDPGDSSAPHRENCSTTLLFPQTCSGGRTRCSDTCLGPVCREVTKFGGQVPLGGGVMRAENASLLGAGRARRVPVRSFRTRTQPGEGPRLCCTHRPVTPCTKTAGDRGKVGHEGGSGWGRRPRYCGAPFVPRIEQPGGMEGGDHSWGFSNSEPGRKRRWDRLREQPPGPRQSSPLASWTYLSSPPGERWREELSSWRRGASGVDAALRLVGKPA